MALPANQTATLIVSEALKQAGDTNPSTARITRGEDEWLRRVLQRISKRLDLTLFEETKVSILNAYESRYALPSDVDRLTEVIVYTGKTTGALQQSVTNSLVLASDEDVDEDTTKGKLIFILSGVAKNEVSRIVDYNSTTKTATISPSLNVLPDIGNTYMIADQEHKLKLFSESNISDVISIRLPKRYHLWDRNPDKEIIFDSAISDQDVGTIKIRYTQHPHSIDLTDSRLTAVYNELQSELTQGVLVEALRDKEDNRFTIELQLFEKYLTDYKRKLHREKIVRMELFST